MTVIQIILYFLLVIACSALLIIIFRSKADVDYLQEEKDGRIINSSTRIIFFVGNALVVWYVVYQVTNQRVVDLMLVIALAGLANSIKMWSKIKDPRQ